MLPQDLPENSLISLLVVTPACEVLNSSASHAAAHCSEEEEEKRDLRTLEFTFLISQP